MSEIPVLDAGDPDFDQQLLEACRTVGFVAVDGHGIDLELVGEMRRVLKQIFALSESRKQALMITPDNYRGFIPFGFFTPNRAEVNGAQPDLYEGFKLHWECPDEHAARTESPMYGTNRWVPEIAEMRDTILRYWAACDQFADRLLAIFATHLGVAADMFRSWFSAPLTNMTLLHYPQQDPTSDPSGIHPHKDTNVITFLYPDAVGGLQVRASDGSWIKAKPSPTALLVNIGEMLELWSGGEFIATPHRVVNRTGHDRYSFPWFLAPNHKIIVEPLVACMPRYTASAMPVGLLSAEVWRTNWPDEAPSDAGFDLGSLDR